MDLQFYPTPPALAVRAYNKFKSKNFTRILEPSAGRGDLLAPLMSRYRTDKIDCIELDLNNQAILRGKKLAVIDGDFLKFTGAPLYSHILMNPPFASGAEHVNHAFDILVNGELVAILNAETVRNPCTAMRRLLVSRIQQHGAVEFIQEAFLDPDTQRKTPVEVALVWMEKTTDLTQHFTVGMKTDTPDGIAGHEEKQELALRGSTIANAVAVFNAAVESLRFAEVAREEANHYARLLGAPMNQMSADAPGSVSLDDLHTRFNNGYDDLKDRAWTNVLQSTEFSKYLSSKAYQRLAADFDSVKRMSFTESNIRGFLLGLVNGQADMNMEMLLDCFDEITRYVPENRAYYRGWKSNLKHKEQAYRVQMTRFIMPRANSMFGSVDYGTIKKLEDFDKVFAMLAGKSSSEAYFAEGKTAEDLALLGEKQLHNVSLAHLFSNKSLMNRLVGGERLSGAYFDVRYYKGAGTIHFFPTNKTLIDRLNRLVGKERQWLPTDEKQGSKAFWQQFEQAEKVTKAMVIPTERWGNVRLDSEDAAGKFMEAHLAACEKVGIDVAAMLAHDASDLAEVA